MIDNKCNARKKHAWYNLKKVQPQKDKIHKDNATTIRSSSFDSSDNVFLTVREVKKTTSKPKA